MNIRDISPLRLRVEPEIKAILKIIAKQEGRSLNSEMVQRLKRTLIQDGLLSA